MASPEPSSIAASPMELPGARQIVGRGFELSLQSSRQLRSASVYFGGLLVALAGPLVLLALAVAGAAPEGLDKLAGQLADPNGWATRRTPLADLPGDWLAGAWMLALAGMIGLAGVTVVAVEGQVVGLALLAGRAMGRPLTLRQALIRSRQVFWQVVWAGSLVSIPLQAFQAMVVSILDAANAPAELSVLLATLLVTAVGAPFGYLMTGIVIGDVGSTEAIRRSIVLARARWPLALAIAVFPAIYSSIQLFALAAGGDLVVRVGQATSLGFERDVAHSMVTVVVILGAIVAAGSLVFTVSAILAAPQVVGFLGLTQFQAGLDRARPPLEAPVAEATAPAPGSDSLVDGSPVSEPAPDPAPDMVAEPASVPRAELVPDALSASPPDLAPPPAPALPREPPRDPAVGFRWVTRSMAAGIAATALLATLGVALVAGRLQAPRSVVPQLGQPVVVDPDVVGDLMDHGQAHLVLEVQGVGKVLLQGEPEEADPVRDE